MNEINVKYFINAAKISILAAIFGLSFFVARSFLIAHPQMSLAITFDLAITLPLLYLLFFRKYTVSKLTAIPLFVFGLIFASVILPESNFLLNALKITILPALELGVFCYAFFIIWKARKTYKSLSENGFDTMENLRETLCREFPMKSIGGALAFEISCFYYAFFSWRKKRGTEFFTYHKNNGVFALLTVIIFLVTVETLILHFLVAGWSPATAWILMIFSAYFVFQLFAHGKAIYLRPIKFTSGEIFIRCGLLGDTKIELNNIEKVELVNQPSKIQKDAINLTPLGKFTQPNVKIVLLENAVLNGFYGFKKNFKVMFLAIDEIENFKKKIEEKKWQKQT